MTNPTTETPLATKLLMFVLQGIPAAVLSFAAVGKLIGAEAAVTVFEKTLDMGAGGRVLIGVLEIACVVMLIVPGTSIYGAVLSLGIMIAAILAHLTTDVGVAGDSLVHFCCACLVAISACAIIYLRRHQIATIDAMFER